MGAKCRPVGLLEESTSLFLDGSYDLSVEAWEVANVGRVNSLRIETVIAVHPQRDLWRQLLAR